MIYNVAFFSKHFCERGTDKTTFDYADYNEKILGNKSYIVCFNESIIRKYGFASTKEFVKNKYLDRFELLEINNISEIRKILKEKEITHFYVQSHGFHIDIFKFNNHDIWQDCKTIYHCAFGPMVRQGSTLRCVVGSYLNKRFRKNLPVLPPIVRPYENIGNFRNQLKIPQDALVIGRHGGNETFDINFVKEAIKKVLKANNSIYFLFLNTKQFINNDRVIYLDPVNDEGLALFIGTCDAMIHGRLDGETFGLAPAEFSAANKPVITYLKSKDKEHLRILKDKAITYKDEDELIKIFMNLKNILESTSSWNAYQDFEPANIMSIFAKICLSERQQSIYDKSLVFLSDLPWEVKVFIERIINFYYLLLLKSIPRSVKDKVKLRLKSLRNYSLFDQIKH
tara:strand:+ start:343 stop:1533 length:1191 start_codon:yes stop_codon:yes gene_type:complete